MKTIKCVIGEELEKKINRNHQIKQDWIKVVYYVNRKKIYCNKSVIENEVVSGGAYRRDTFYRDTLLSNRPKNQIWDYYKILKPHINKEFIAYEKKPIKNKKFYNTKKQEIKNFIINWEN